MDGDATLETIDAFAWTEEQLEHAIAAQQPVEPGPASVFRATANVLFYRHTGENLGAGAKGTSTEVALQTQGTPAHVVQRLLTFWLQVHAGAVAILSTKHATYDEGIDETALVNRTGYSVTNLRTAKEVVSRAADVRAGRAVPTIPALLSVLSKWYARVTPYCYLGARTEQADRDMRFPANLMTSAEELRTLAKYGSVNRENKVSKPHQLMNLKQLMSTSATPLLALWPVRDEALEIRRVRTTDFPLGVSAPLDCLLDTGGEEEGADDSAAGACDTIGHPRCIAEEVVLGNPLVTLEGDAVSIKQLVGSITIARTAEGGQWVAVYPLLQSVDKRVEASHFALQLEQARVTHMGLEESLVEYRERPPADKPRILFDAIRELQPRADTQTVNRLVAQVLGSVEGDGPRVTAREEFTEAVTVAYPPTEQKESSEQQQQEYFEPDAGVSAGMDEEDRQATVAVDDDTVEDARRYAQDFGRAVAEERREDKERVYEQGLPSQGRAMRLVEGQQLANSAQLPLPTSDEEVQAGGVDAAMLWDSLLKDSNTPVPGRKLPPFVTDAEVSMLRPDARNADTWNGDLTTACYPVGRPSKPSSMHPVVLPLQGEDASKFLVPIYKFVKAYTVGHDRGVSGQRQACIVAMKQPAPRSGSSPAKVQCVAAFIPSGVRADAHGNEEVFVSVVPLSAQHATVPAKEVKAVSPEPLIEVKIGGLVPVLVAKLDESYAGDVSRARDALQYLAENAVNTVKGSSPSLVPNEQAQDLVEGDRVYVDPTRNNSARDVVVRVRLTDWLTSGERHVHNLNHFLKHNTAVAIRREDGGSVNMLLLGGSRQASPPEGRSAIELSNIVVCKVQEHRRVLPGQDTHLTVECMPKRIDARSIPARAAVSQTSPSTVALVIPTTLLMLISSLANSDVVSALHSLAGDDVDVRIAVHNHANIPACGD